MVKDQAEGLRALHGAAPQSLNASQPQMGKDMNMSQQQKPIRVLAVASGKGGVGKTNVSVNLGISLQKLGNRVVLLDADMGLANVDIMLGLSTKYNLAHVMDGKCSLQEVMVEGPGGIRIIPGSSGVRRMAQLGAAENAGIIHAFSEIANDLDILIIDTAAGIADSVVSFCRAAQEVLVVVTDEPASITDAYALIKVLNRDYGVNKFRLIANQARSAEHGLQLYKKLYTVTEQFLDISLDYLGPVPYDNQLKEAVQKQVPVTVYRPNALASRKFFEMAKTVDRWPIPQGASGYLQFFVENIFQG